MRLTGVSVLGLVVLLSTLDGATVGDRLSDASIALRYGGTKLLIIGDLAENGALQGLTAGGLDRFPKLQIDAILSPGWTNLEITSKIFRGLEAKVKVRAGFDVGARWQLDVSRVLCKRFAG